MVEERRLRIPGSLEKVRVACDFVVEAARRSGLGDRAIYHCQLAVDEACTNIIEHGYGMNGANQVIDVICRQEPDRFVITVIDDSAPFNPLTIKEPDRSALLEDRKEGGWGIFFIKKVMDEVSYQQQGNRNRLMMVKNLGK